MDQAVIWEWLEFSVRWLHVVTAIAWIGSSFYFIALDLGLHRHMPAELRRVAAPAAMPGDLIWFKWESYGTWLSGFAMLVLVYYLGADLYLIDPGKADLAVWQAVAVSVASLALGWIAYNTLCKLFVTANQTALMVALFALLVAMSWFYTQVFTGRAALLHLGAFTATIMSANVFFIIIPNQKIVVADLIAGRRPDPKFGKIAKQRSTHNNYLTLPVVFLMLSNHYPLAFATEYNWIIAALVFLTGVTIRHWFNSRHARKGSPHWTWGVTLALMLAIAWLSAAGSAPRQEARLSGMALHYAAAPGFDDVVALVQANCTMCHAAEPALSGVARAPKAVELETPAQIAQEARRIHLQAGISRAMPPPAHNYMTEEDRAVIRAWFANADGAGI